MCGTAWQWRFCGASSDVMDIFLLDTIYLHACGLPPLCIFYFYIEAMKWICVIL
jgi:hypothetical protein